MGKSTGQPIYDYVVERVDNWAQMQRTLDRHGEAGYRLHTIEKTGTKTYQVIMERVSE